jgi:hypothetical protein
MSRQKAQWTVLVYVAAHNNLEDLGLRSLKQILNVGSTSQLKLAVLYDSYDGAARYIAGEPGQAAVEEQLSEFDSGDPDALLETARWAFEQCPAERYALILWSHGTGWRPETEDRSVGRAGYYGWQPAEIARIARQARGDDEVSESDAADRSAAPGGRILFRSTLEQILQRDDRAICFDDGTGRSLDTLELERVMHEIAAITGQPLDLLGMDACLMANLETAYQVREHVCYLVASEELVPGYSWPYDTILATLRGNDTMPAADLAQLIVSEYVAFYEKHPPMLNYGDVTKVALDLSRIDDIAQAADELAGAVLANLSTQAPLLWEVQNATKERETFQGKRKLTCTKFAIHLWDLGAVAASLALRSSDAAVQAAARAVGEALRESGAVIKEDHRGEWFDGIGGLSIYAWMPGVERISPFYEDVAFAQDTRWSEMLHAYHRLAGV